MTQQHSKIVQDLSYIGLANAASAFSMITNDRVTFRKPTYGEQKPVYRDGEGALQLLFTPFIGEVLFESYLIVREKDGARIVQGMMPGLRADNTSMMQAALLELDNIISAAIATKFSDLLNSQITGDIPRAYVKTKLEVDDYIHNRLTQFDSYTSCHTRFKLVHLKAEADFIFLFKADFGKIVASLTDTDMVKVISNQSTQEARRFVG